MPLLVNKQAGANTRLFPQPFCTLWQLLARKGHGASTHPDGPLALVLLPTRELAQQVGMQAGSILTGSMCWRAAAFAGCSRGEQGHAANACPANGCPITPRSILFPHALSNRHYPLQVASACRDLRKYSGLRTACITGGTDRQQQMEALGKQVGAC